MTWLAELRRRDGLLFWSGLASFAGLVLAALLMLVDARSVLGVNVWLKPAKFGASIGLYLWTLAWLRPHLPTVPPSQRPALPPSQRPALPRVRVVVAVAMLIELICIFGQAARGVGSHFNEATVFDALVFNAMGLAIACNTVALAVLTVAAWRAPAGAMPALGWGIRVGLALVVLGGLEGGLMIENAGHSVGVSDGGPGLPITTWSTRGGDLRVAHFVALHALQVLPLLGWAMARRAGSDPAAQRRASGWVIAVGGAWLLVCAGALLFALLGRPILRM